MPSARLLLWFLLLVSPAKAWAQQQADPARLLDHIKVLAADDFEGRAPASPGEDKTVAYLTSQFQKLGLQPGNPDGTFVQQVPLVGFKTTATGSLKVQETTIPLDTPEAWVAVSRRLIPEVQVDSSDIVFVGYGVVAPEYGWDDYKGLDVKGKTLLMLVNDPPVPLPHDPSQLDPAVFGGRAMTYYGRWTYKYEIAAEKGASAVLLVHETKPAGYPYEVVKGSWGRENFEIPTPDNNASRPAIEAWIPLPTAQQLCQAAGLDFEALKAQAAKPDFQPRLLPRATASFKAANELRETRSQNVLARLPGADPALADELIIYTAHWDHLGRDDSLAPADTIYNGAADNASGTAGVLEIARLFAEAPAPKRSVLFLAVTAEEKGLLGSRYYATQPLYPLEKTLAVLNMDVINLWGRTTDITSVGLGQSTLDDTLTALAAHQGRTVNADPEPEKGMYYRSDHFEFARVGVPALNAKGGMSFRDKPATYGQQKRDEYTANDYHKPSDEIKPDWDLTGAVEDLKLLYLVGREVASAATYPEWKPASEFRARRQAMLQEANP